VKTPWERLCELQTIDKWLQENPRKADVLAILSALAFFSITQVLHLTMDWVAGFSR